MSELSATSVDRLTRYGILDGAQNVQQRNVTDSAVLNNEPTADVLDLQNVQQQNGKLKTYGAIALLTYLTGVACSKGKLNPLDGLSSIYDVLAAGVTKFLKLFKRSWK